MRRQLARWRTEKVERTMAHSYETGGLRRIHLRGHVNILKRVLVHVAGLNLGLVLTQVLGVGTPRGLQGRAGRLLAIFFGLIQALWTRLDPPADRFTWGLTPALTAQPGPVRPFVAPNRAFATGC